MFKVELDLELYYEPLMDEHASGILVTRTLELPFAPTSDVSVWSKAWDECPEPVGFWLKDLVWDLDRQTFLAKTQSGSIGQPLALIPYEIRSWVDRGWRLGSWMDAYRDKAPEAAPERAASDEAPFTDNHEMKSWETRRPADRPAEFDRVFGAIIRTLAELRNNWSVAYAMHRTKLFFVEADLKNDRSPAVERWLDTKHEFSVMPVQKQLAWQSRVIKKYPALAAVVAGLPKY